MSFEVVLITELSKEEMEMDLLMSMFGRPKRQARLVEYEPDPEFIILDGNTFEPTDPREKVYRMEIADLPSYIH